MRREFDREGLGYVMRVQELALEVSVDRLTRSRGDMHGEISVECGLPGTRSYDGHLHGARFNLSATRSRTELANTLKARSSMPDVDWQDLLEDFCRRVLAMERQGEPVTYVGDRPQRIAPAWRLDPILPNDKPTILYGEGGTGKSTLATAIAVSVQTGVAIIEGWAPRKANVLYLDWETSADDVDEHVKGVAAGANIPTNVRIRYRRCFAPLADETDEIARIVGAEDIGLLIVDSVGLASGSGGDGDASETAIRLFGAFRAIGTTVLAVDHVSKGDAQDPNRPARPYGSIYKTNLARATFELRRSPMVGETARIGVFNTKSNVRRLLPPIGLEVTQDEVSGVIRFGVFDVAGDADLGRKSTVWDRARVELQEAGDLSDEELVERLDIKPNVLRSTLSRASGQGLVERLPSSKKWRLITRAS